MNSPSAHHSAVSCIVGDTSAHFCETLIYPNDTPPKKMLESWTLVLALTRERMQNIGMTLMATPLLFLTFTITFIFCSEKNLVSRLNKPYKKALHELHRFANIEKISSKRRILT